MKNILLFFTVLFTLALSFNLSAQEGDLKSMDQIAKEMSNPTLPMFNLAMFYDYQNTTGNLSGANNQNINLIGIQPPLPFPLKNGKNLIIRPLFSFNFAAPVFNENGFESAGGVHFGDIPIDVLYAGTNPKTGVMFGYGLVANIPTSSSQDLRGEWKAGPSLLLGLLKKHVFVLIVNNSFELSGTEKQSVLGGQYVAAFSLKGGWQIVASPPWSYNWATEQLTLPIGGGPFKTIMIGKTPVKIGVQFNYYISQPDPFGPQWGIRFNITPSLKRPW